MNVYIFDNEPLTREIIGNVCTAELGYTILAEANSAPEAIELLRKREPDFVVMDLLLESGTGFDVLRESDPCKHRTFVLTSFCTPFAVWRASRVNVHGFMAKEEVSIASLKEGIACVSTGGQYWSERYREIRLRLISEPFSFVKILTNAEMRVLSLFARGLSDAEIASHLGITSRTAQTHRSNISRKVGIQRATQLMAYAISCGFDRFGFEPPKPLASASPMSRRPFHATVSRAGRTADASDRIQKQ